MAQGKRKNRILQFEIENQDNRPWNSVKIQKVSGNYRKSGNQSGIYSLSNREFSEASTNRKITSSRINDYTLKPKTASPTTRARKLIINQQLSRLGYVSKKDVINDDFEKDIQNLNIHSNFRTSIQQKKQLLFLKPQMKKISQYANNSKKMNVNTTQGLENLKTQVYKSLSQHCKLQINSSYCQTDQTTQFLQTVPLQQSYKKQSHSSFIQYLTGYQGENIKAQNKTNCLKKPRKSSNMCISILRDKLKSKYKNSKYIYNIDQIKCCSGSSVTIK